MAGGEMIRDEGNIPQSALYTSATWQWGRLPCAEFVTPEGADKLFNVVNAYMRFYRWLNPKKFSLQHTLLHRHTAINTLLARSGCEQVIEIAAGFSPRGSATSREPGIHYCEVDLPDVVSAKRRQLESTDAGREVLARENFELRAGDVTQLDFARDFASRKSFIITEGLMMYFKREEQMAIWNRIATFLRQSGGEYVFDYIPIDDEPPRSAAGKLLHGIKTLLGGDRQGYCYDERTRLDVRDDLLQAGFSQVDVYDSYDIAANWNLPQAEEKTRVIIYRCR